MTIDFVEQTVQSVFPLSVYFWFWARAGTSAEFLVATKRLYKRVLPSPRRAVRRSVRRSVGPSVTLLLKTVISMILIANNVVSCNQIIIQSFHHHEDASLALLLQKLLLLFQRF